MNQSFFIPGRLPGANECLWKHWRVFSRLKKKHQSIVSQVIRADHLKPTKRVSITFEWHEPNRRRDLDNISFGQKFILDALAHEGILKNDSQKYVKELTHMVRTDGVIPGVLVTLEEAS